MWVYGSGSWAPWRVALANILQASIQGRRWLCSCILLLWPESAASHLLQVTVHRRPSNYQNLIHWTFADWLLLIDTQWKLIVMVLKQPNWPRILLLRRRIRGRTGSRRGCGCGRRASRSWRRQWREGGTPSSSRLKVLSLPMTGPVSSFKLVLARMFDVINWRFDKSKSFYKL